MNTVAEKRSLMPRIVVLSGPVGSGKSTLASDLTDRYGANHIRTQEIIKSLAAQAGVPLPNERKALQDYGDLLDEHTDGAWVADAVDKCIGDSADNVELIIVDAVRRLAQIEALRDRYPARVTHIHVDAPTDVLESRYEERKRSAGPLQELHSYRDVALNKTESQTTSLGQDADVSIDTDRCSSADVAIRAAAALRLDVSRSARLVDVLIGGQYGSEGKGNIAYFMAQEYDLLMRVGGPNAGHKVPTKDTAYTHRLLPSGTLANSRAKLLIGPGATLDVQLLLKEISECGVENTRLVIDPQAMIIEDSDKAAESHLKSTIGSTGKGGGSAASRRIMGRTGGGEEPVRLAKDVDELAPYIGSAADLLEETFRRNGRVLLEGTQGTGLSIYHGHYPHVTSRDTTTSATLAEAGIGPHRLRRVVMVIRTYPIRVGNPINGESGHMSQEVDWDKIADRSGHDETVLRDNEKGSVSGTKRRVGEFDWVQLKRAANLNGATDIALTFTDYIDKQNEDARRFEQLSEATVNFVEEVEKVAGAPVSLIGTRFDKRSVIDRREW
ncbi:adenylosuccinate synthetase [Cryobacterium sp. TMT4-31]|uniref:adenylosuccinate synthetase n=1 Tax=Cryobacterium sp. TMT4-31 TaxID=1259259 RepID=UPI00106D98E7|nr:adenylosuccinate synthetase [Cryobacterium sp. TMT4-31]TFC86496.1 adenylosuccinate synthase [Cryobacterium sp. TMT4-31]